eukprot:XP_011617319.1 PREDICTED: olfactomedin-like protein 3 isoform X1 [Takifugu rubripes]
MRGLLLVLVSTAWTLAAAQYYYQGLMDYLENRLSAMECCVLQDRMQLYQHQSHGVHTELQNFRKRAAETVDGLKNQHLDLFKDLERAAVRLEQLEQDMDAVEIRTSPRACGNAADRVLEQEVWRREEEEEEGEWEEEWEEGYTTVSDCVEILSAIRSVKILKRVGGAKGLWTRDPSSSRVYVFNGTSGDAVYQFDSVREFSRSAGVAGGRLIRLPSDWTGAGGAVYNGYLYYVHQETRTDVQLVKFDLMSGAVSDAAVFPAEGGAPVYELNPETVADVAADDEGLWVLYAASGAEPNINLAKLDRDSLDIEQIWDTGCPREKAEAAFVICGTVYVAYNTRLASRSRLQCLFDVNGVVVSEEAPLLYFPRRYGAHASLKYNPEERQLYAWDDGYQIIYRLSLKRKLLL